MAGRIAGIPVRGVGIAQRSGRDMHSRSGRPEVLSGAGDTDPVPRGAARRLPRRPGDVVLLTVGLALLIFQLVVFAGIVLHWIRSVPL